MCRWLAYLGSSIDIVDIRVRPTHSLIYQSLPARQLYLPLDELASGFADHAFPNNGDGFGMAWAGRSGKLGKARAVPADRPGLGQPESAALGGADRLRMQPGPCARGAGRDHRRAELPPFRR